MNGHKITLILSIFILVLSSFYSADVQATSKDTLSGSGDSLSKMQIRQENRMAWRKDLRQSHNQYFLRTNIVFANLETEIQIEILHSNLLARIGLEENLKLPNQQSLVSATFMGRITPRSGIYAEYYGLNRSYSTKTTQDYIFLNDTLPAGQEGGVYFNTQIFSIGYLISLLKNPDAYLGLYFNIYMMKLNTGIYTDIRDFSWTLNTYLPFPNIGLLTAYRLSKRFYLYGEVGLFAMKLSTLDVSLNSLNIELIYKPIKWLGLCISYQHFNIQAVIPENTLDIEINYTYKGPAVGLTLSF